MGGAITYVYRNGARLTPWMLYIITLLDAEIFRLFGVHVVVSSGIRTYGEQVSIFLSRYVKAGDVRGRRVYDTRVWNGVRWYRISSAGTVAVPSTSNHEIQGDRAAVDLRDTGRDAGIATMGSRRSNWLRANAARFGLVPSGFGFGEAWHYDVLGIFRTPPAPKPPAPKPEPEPVLEDEEEENTMKIFGYKKPGETRTVYVEMDFAGGLWHEFVTSDADYARSVADKWGGGAPMLSTGHRDGLADAFDRRWPGMRRELDGSEPVK